VEAAARRDPVDRLRVYLARSGHWSPADEEGLLGRTAAEVEEAVSHYIGTAALPAEAMFDYLYASLPASLEAQRRAVAGG
ncbi:MAG: pyruvate dehydrogenase (acetyl-transferring) E1 component subunit alpha, partial [Candidatus Rokubacteria bacterium]|nr:pyruvate dehydrogenase (acetyl-transferring) E1 component subunit alpha [Candidatus Rokubacteria bacterium]